MTDYSTWITNEIKRFTLESPDNSLRNSDSEKSWDEPTVAFSSASDPLYQYFKDDIGDFYWTPLEIYRRAFPKEKDASADKLSIISWILPQTQRTKTNQRKMKEYPCENWVRSRIFGESFNDKLRQHIVDISLRKGVNALSPVLLPEWQVVKNGKYGFASNWSERHTAYISGLGTFGLCDGLITALGKAVRFGSVIVKVQVPVKNRPYKDMHEYCLFYAMGKCKACAARCPAGAISENGHDKEKCNRYLRDIVARRNDKVFSLKGGGCGLCQSRVPCESGIPSVAD